MTEQEKITIPDTRFEQALKKSPFLDLCFRGVSWVAISMIATFFAIENLAPLDYLSQLGHSLARLLNLLGSAALIICIPALMTKDLEATLKKDTHKAIATCGLAGLFRRLASDLTIWSLGALITLLIALVIVMTKIKLETSDYLPATITIMWIVGLLIGVSLANIQIRLPRPTPLACLHPGLVALIYVSTFVFITYFGVLKETLI